MILEVQRRWSNLPRLVRIAGGTLLFWTFVVLVSYGWGGAELIVDGRREPLASWTFVAHAVRTYGMFWLCSTAALWLAPRWTAGGTVRWWAAVGWTCVFGCLWSFEALLQHRSLTDALRFFVTTSPMWLMQAGSFVAAGIAWQLWGQSAERERTLQQAQLRALRAQLQPHFLFNTLHAIGVTANRDGPLAARMTTLLGDLLRHTLRERTAPLVPLAEELALLEPYLQLQQLRFQDRLRVHSDLPPDVLGALVPDLLLQPLVENALQHGIEQRPGAGSVTVSARRVGAELVIEVQDDGVPAKDALARAGTGLSVTRDRLRALFGARASLHVAGNALGGTTATLRLPFAEVRHAA